jgi:hypothetical protein
MTRLNTCSVREFFITLGDRVEICVRRAGKNLMMTAVAAPDGQFRGETWARKRVSCLEAEGGR